MLITPIGLYGQKKPGEIHISPGSYLNLLLYKNLEKSKKK